MGGRWFLFLALLAALVPIGIYGSRFVQPRNASVDTKTPDTPVRVDREDLLSADLPDVDLANPLERPGEPRAALPESTTAAAMSEPLAPRLAQDLALAKSGESHAAAALARDLIRCSHFLKQLQQLSSAIALTEAANPAATELSALEDLTLAHLNASNLGSLCDGVEDADLSAISDLLRIAVEGGELSVLPDYIENGLSQQNLLEYLRNPQAYDEFRRTATNALENGARQCDERAIWLLGESYSAGVLLPTDPSRAFTYELVSTWLTGLDPATALRLQAMQAALSASQLNVATAQAHQFYSRYCQ